MMTELLAIGGLFLCLGGFVWACFHVLLMEG
jgi:hypothetical protein